MVYDPNIPASNQLISASQSPIQGNFAAIDSSSSGFSVDHVTLTDPTNGGKHKKMTMVQQGAAPTTAVDELDIYTKSVTTGALIQPEIYVRQQSNGTEFLLTRGAPVAASGEGGAYSGLMIRSGTCNSNAAGSLPATFSTAFPTACIAVVVTGTNSAQLSNVIKVNNASITPSGFTCFSTLGESCRYIAVGY